MDSYERSLVKSRQVACGIAFVEKIIILWKSGKKNRIFAVFHIRTIVEKAVENQNFQKIIHRVNFFGFQNYFSTDFQKKISLFSTHFSHQQRMRSLEK